jgi:flagellar biogenesis protein FliO
VSDPVEAIGSIVLWTGLIVGALLLVRRWAQRGGRMSGGPVPIRVVARTGLTKGSVVAVLEADGRRFLIGAADQRITLLSELDPDIDDPIVADANRQLSAAAASRSSALPPALASALTPATERQAPTPDRPWIGLLDRLRMMTVRTHVERPIRAPGT